MKLGGVRPGTIKSNEAAKAKADGDAEQLRPILEAMVAKGATLREMASALAGVGRTLTAGHISSEAAMRSPSVPSSESVVVSILEN